MVLINIEYHSRFTVPNRANDFFSPSIKILFISNLGLGAAITITNHLLDNLIPSIRDFEFSPKRCFGFSVPDSQKSDLQLFHVFLSRWVFFYSRIILHQCSSCYKRDEIVINMPLWYFCKYSYFIADVFLFTERRRTNKIIYDVHRKRNGIEDKEWAVPGWTWTHCLYVE